MRPPTKRPIGPDSDVCQAMRLSGSYSITVLDMEYGTPIFIDMPKVEPSVSLSGAPSLVLTSAPEPSISGWRVASATMAKMADAGALITRSTLTVLPSMSVLPGPGRSRSLPGDYGSATAWATRSPSWTHSSVAAWVAARTTGGATSASKASCQRGAHRHHW